MALFDPKKNQIAALQKSIDDKNRAIGVYYSEIGMLYYKQYKDMNVDVSKEINSRCENISTLYIEIEECRLRILYERGFKECAYCKKENLLEHAYCSACGQKFPESNDVSVVTRVDPVTLGPVGLKANDVPTVTGAAAAVAAAPAASDSAEKALESVDADSSSVSDNPYGQASGVATENAEQVNPFGQASAAAVEEVSQTAEAVAEEEPYELGGDVCAEVPEEAVSEEVVATAEEETLQVSGEN